MIIKVYNSNNELLEENFPKKELILSKQISFIITNLLRDVVENGTGKIAKKIDVPLAVKTGTTNDSSDTWFIGYSPSIITTVQVEYDEFKQIEKNQTGASLAGPILVDYMKEIFNIPYKNFKANFYIPKNIIFIPINRETGLRTIETNNNNYFMEAFIKRTEPEETSIYSEIFNIQ